jgi:HEAT repeat protein
VQRRSSGWFPWASRSAHKARVQAPAAALPGLQAKDDIHKQVRAALLDALKDDKVLVRVAAANALARLTMSPRDAAVTVPPLTVTLKDTDAQVRVATAGVLAGLGTARPVAGGQA